ncbi:MAG: hypothetical protein JXB13_14020 [Phycisphaerae bacterium]|nr:hypothetical protein [Phycisphaerae bacterium]
MKTVLMVAIAAALVAGVTGRATTLTPMTAGTAGILDEVGPHVQNEAPNDPLFRQAAEEPDILPQTCTPVNAEPFEEPTTAADGEERQTFEIVGDWCSWKYHGAALGKLDVKFPQAPLTRAPIETREGSVTELTFTFSHAADPATFSPASVIVCPLGTPPPTTATLSPDGITATLTWPLGAIQNGESGGSVHNHYTVCICSTVKDTLNPPNSLSGDRDVDFAASFGNVRTDGVIANWQNVNANDRSALVANYTNTPTAAQAAIYDIRITGPANMGRINANDRSWLTNSFSGTALPLAAPPCTCP